MSIAIQTDLRSQLGPVRNQGSRPSCLAFSLSELNRFHGNGADPLSAEYLYRSTARLIPGWQPYDGLTLDEGLTAVESPGQPLDAHCPYLADEPSIPFGPMAAHSPMHTNKFTQKPLDAAAVWTTVEGRAPVGIGIMLTLEFLRPNNGIVAASISVLPNSGHAVLVVGTGVSDSSKERHFLIRNSWGAGWGLGGHAWIPKQYLDAHLICAFGA